MVLVFVVDVTLEHCFLCIAQSRQDSVVSNDAIRSRHVDAENGMTRFVRGMVMPKMVTSLVVRLSVHASVGADVD